MPHTAIHPRLNDSPSVVDLDLLERWQTGWSLARGLPLPRRQDGALVVEAGLADQLRRHVFADAGPALAACAARTHEAFVFLKAAVDAPAMRAALDHRWVLDEPLFLMTHDGPMRHPAVLAPGYTAAVEAEHGARLIRLCDGCGATASIGRVVVHGRTAVFDRIETAPEHQRKGLASVLMARLDQLIGNDGAGERLLVATEAGCRLYRRLGWRILSPYSSAFLPSSE